MGDESNKSNINTQFAIIMSVMSISFLQIKVIARGSESQNEIDENDNLFVEPSPNVSTG